MRYLSWNNTASSSVKKEKKTKIVFRFSWTGRTGLFPVFPVFASDLWSGWPAWPPRTVLKKHRGRRGDFTDRVERGFRLLRTYVFVKCVYVWTGWRAGPADRVEETPGTTGVSKVPSDSVAKIGNPLSKTPPRLPGTLQKLWTQVRKWCHLHINVPSSNCTNRMRFSSNPNSDAE